MRGVLLSPFHKRASDRSHRAKSGTGCLEAVTLGQALKKGERRGGGKEEEEGKGKVCAEVRGNERTVWGLEVNARAGWRSAGLGWGY